MNKIKVISILTVLVILGFIFKNTLLQNSNNKSRNIEKREVAKNYYWTCPMHPQIHSDHVGECPICHMRLVKISGVSKAEEKVQAQTEVRNEIQISPAQQEILEIHKNPVEKMTLNIHIPVSGRMISSNSVAFQIYESDLRYIKTGLHFKGTTALNPDVELQGFVSAVDSVVDSTSRTIRIIGTVTKGPSQHASETSFRGDIILELQNRIAIPESSVLHTGDGDFVYMMNDSGKLTPTIVVLGLKADSFYEVLSGLTTNDTICSGPNFLIDSEAKIRGAN